VKRVFVSDLHMSAGWSLDKTEGVYDWFDKTEAQNFANFLETLKADGALDEVILLGDILDDWIYPIDVQPPTYEEIVSAAHVAPIVSSLKQLAETKKVVYVRGNHDMSIMDNALRGFRQKYFPGITFQESYVTDDGIFAQHGHQYLMWNAEDPAQELPVGYYISRLLASLRSAKMLCTIPEVVATLAYVGSEGNPLVNAPLTFLANKLSMTDRTPITTADGGKITLGQVRKTYADLSTEWAKIHGPLDPVSSIWREVDGLWGVAGPLAVHEKKKVMLFAHTHTEMNCELASPSTSTDPSMPAPPAYALYANCGSWCDFNDPENPKPYSYVVIESDGGKHTVMLSHWGGGQPRTTEISFAPAVSSRRPTGLKRRVSSGRSHKRGKVVRTSKR
jgi:UDP-2,3-diacylglucosamine pyrophosphatase LpxH